MSDKSKHWLNSVRGAGRRFAALFMTFTTATMTVASGGVMTALAAETEPSTQTFTVTLADSENGSLAFDGSEGSTLDVTSGESVTVIANADETYSAASVSVVGTSGEVQSIEVDENDSVTFVPTEDSVLTGHFTSSDANAHADALESLDIEGKTGTSYQDYIKEHMDSKYVGNGDSLTVEDYMRTNVTIADGTQFKGTDLDEMWDKTDADGDGMADNASALVAQDENFIALYEVSEDGDYFVGRVGGDIEGAKLTDWGAAKNNGEAEMLDDIIFDEDTQLVYVPKKYMVQDEDGNDLVLSTYIQLFYVTEGNPDDVKANVSVTVNAKGIRGEVQESGSAGASLFATQTIVKLAQDDESAKSIDADSIDSIEVMGITYDASSGVWAYDESTGELVIGFAAINEYDVRVNMSESFLKDMSRLWNGVTNMFVLDANAGSLSGTIRFSETPKVGQEIIVDSYNIYDKNGRSGWTNPSVSASDQAAGGIEQYIALQTTGKRAVNLSDLVTTSMSIMRSAHISKQTVDGIDIPELKVDLMCSHVNISVGDDYAIDAYNGDYNGKALIRIFAINGAKMTIGITNPTRGGQAGAGFFTINWEQKGGYVSATKVSANPAYTNGNSAYDMTGARYGVFSDKACKNRVDVLTVQNNTGVTNEVGPLDEGTYYIKELAKSDGSSYAKSGYLVNDNVKSVEVTSGSHKNVKLNGVMSEPTAKDPMTILVQKALNGESKAGTLRGNVTLEGVQFRVDYYADIYGSVSAAEKSGKPTASAVFATNKAGYLTFAFVKPVSGTWPYQTTTGLNYIPLGTVVVTEISAPEGVIVSSAGSSAQAFTLEDKDGDGKVSASEHTILGTWPSATTDGKDAVGTVSNEIYGGGVLIVKADASWNESRNQGDGSLSGIKYNITNISTNKVEYNGKDIQSGEVVTTIETKWDDNLKAYVAKTDNVVWKDGEYQVDTSKRDIDLEFGTYLIEEINSNDDGSANESYQNAGWSQTIEISEDGQLHSYDSATNSWNTNEPWYGGLRVGKVDRETGQYISLGEAHLDGSVFEVINRSAEDVEVYGVTYKPGEVVMTVATELHEDADGTQRYYADTGKVLPYGTYEVHEVSSGTGYLFDNESKSWTATLTQHTHNGYVDILDESEVAANQVIREDWSFKKKDEGSMERMNNVAFLVTSNTTGESHIIVTDENGTWGSSWVAHTDKTNANDPDSPISNGAIEIDEDGNYVVVDQSKLDSEAGTWFTGMSSDMTKWAEDGKSYTVNNKTVAVRDDLRAFPYDTYTVTELPSEANEGHIMVTFTVTLHKYGNPNGEGIDLDYGTIDDKVINIATTLSSDTGKSVPSNGVTNLTDTVSYEGLSAGTKYGLVGELHAVDAEGKDLGVVATAETSFSATGKTGTVDVIFENVDMASVGSNTLVAFEYLKDANGKDIASHADLTDENQTVTVPTIGTTLKGVVEHEGDASLETIELVDTVDYKGLEVGKNYTLTGTLMDKSTGEAITDADGNAITATTTFAPTKASGSADVVFSFSNVDVAGKTVVAFESLTSDGVEFATHADIEDEGQTVTFPEVGTTAKDGVDGDKFITADKEQTVVDTVKASNLVVGKEYTVSGTLHVQKIDADGNVTDGGTLKDADGNDVAASTTFTADSEQVEVELSFTFDASELGGKPIVAFETLSRGDVKLGLHADITDEDQTVYVPKIGTTLVSENGTHTAQASAAETSESSDEQAEATETVTESAESTETSAEAESTETADATADSESEDTEAAKSDSDAKASETVTLTDTVTYENLAIGKEYTVNGVLHLQDVDDEGNIVDGGVMKDADGNEVTATAKFTPEQSSGTVDVTFTFDAAGMAGKSVVAFESVEYDGKRVAVHEDITDEGQTVKFVDVGTTAVDKTTETHVMSETTSVSIIDTVAYTGLTVGQEYTVSGTLHLQKVDEDGNITDGGVLTDVDGKEVTASATFTPEAADGTVDVAFDFDIEAGALDGSTVVAFEDLSENGVVIATHSDITDESQAVHKLKVGTTLTGADGKAKDVQVGDKIDVIDTVAFENLVIGEEYTVKGTLVDAKGNALKDSDGNVVTAETKFTPEKTSGTVELTFTVDTSNMADGDKIVAYEYVYSANGTLVGKHEDLNDTDQTVTVKKDSETPKEHVTLQTGIGNAGMLIAILMVVVLGGVSAYYVRKRRTEA